MSCLSPELSLQCNTSCTNSFDKCLIQCNDEPICISTCNRQYGSCVSDCPCGANCTDGCPCEEPSTWCCRAEPENSFQHQTCVIKSKQSLNDCLDLCEFFDAQCHQICTDVYNVDINECPCMENCVGGCPCNGFDCNELKSPIDLQIYALDSVKWEDKECQIIWNVTYPGQPLQITPVNNFQQIDESNKRYRCAFQYKGQFHLVGGSGNFNKSHYVLNSELQQLNDLDFAFDGGLCYGAKEEALVCAPAYNNKACWRYDGSFSSIESTTHNHYLGGLTFYMDEFLIIAGWPESWEAMGKVESYNDGWNIFPGSHELLNNYKNFSPVVLGKTLFLFGDYFRNGDLLMYDQLNGWQVHAQKFSHYGQTSIGSGNQVVHLGTSDGASLPVEYWELQPTGEFKITQSEATFENWYVPYMWLTEHV